LPLTGDCNEGKYQYHLYKLGNWKDWNGIEVKCVKNNVINNNSNKCTIIWW